MEFYSNTKTNRFHYGNIHKTKSDQIKDHNWIRHILVYPKYQYIDELVCDKNLLSPAQSSEMNQSYRVFGERLAMHIIHVICN